MTETGRVIVELVGGPMDGDEIVLAANGSVSTPQQLSYMTATADEAGWLVYEAENVFDGAWPDEDEKRRYQFVGTYSLGKGRLLKSA